MKARINLKMDIPEYYIYMNGIKMEELKKDIEQLLATHLNLYSSEKKIEVFVSHIMQVES